jgi:hypothetical protein
VVEAIRRKLGSLNRRIEDDRALVKRRRFSEQWLGKLVQ